MIKKVKTAPPHRNACIACLVISALMISIGFFFHEKSLSGLKFSSLGTIRFSTQAALFVAAILSAGTGLVGLVRCVSAGSLSRGVYILLLAFNALLCVSAVVVMAAGGGRIDVVGLAAQSIRLSTPIALGALAGVLCERSGVINIGIEGMMLASACIGFTAALYFQNIWVGLFAAMIGGAAMAVIHAVLSISLSVDQIISGTVINILAVGATGFVRRTYLITSSLFAPPLLPRLEIPLLSDIPLLGKILFSHQPVVYTMILLTVVIHVGLFRTRWGLRTRTVGENPHAADSAGIDVIRLRYLNVIAGGAVAGLGGAWFSLETVGNFDILMTGGKGFIALAAMIFGKWNPVGAVGGALLFGFADALQIKLQISGAALPHQFLNMIPYVITMVVLAGVVGKAVAPAADGIPFERGE